MNKNKLCIDCNKNPVRAKNRCVNCYKKFRIKQIQLQAPKRKCICSPDCEEMICSIGSEGQPILFAKGHNLKLGGELHPKWKGGRIKIGYYWYLRVPQHPNADSRGYVAEHIFVMSSWLRRPLKRGEVVHHINEDKEDNRLENLKLTTVQLHPTEHIIDMSGRICAICDGKTWIDPKNNRPVWHEYGDQAYICHTCYQLYLPYTCFGTKDISEFGARPLKKDRSDTFCILCGDKTTIDSRGYPRWHKYMDGYRCDICYKRSIRKK